MAGKTIAAYNVKISAETGQVTKGYKQIDTGAKKMAKGVDTQTKKMDKSFGNLFTKLRTGWLLVAGIFTGLVARGFSKVIGLASDLEEETAKFGTVFRGVAEEAEAMRDSLVASYGVSTLEATRMLSSIQDFLIPMGFARREGAKFSDTIAKLAVDIGSFNNAPTAQVLEDIKSGIAGMSRPLRKYGIDISENTLKQLALSKGIELVNGTLDRQTRVMLLLEKITEDSADAMGDFQRTAGSFANQSKILGATLSNLAAKIGSAMIPAVTGFISKLNQLLTGETDLGIATKELIGLTDDYRIITDKLKDSQNELTKSEKNLLLLRKEEIEVKILENIKKINKHYKKGNIFIETGSEELKRQRETAEKYQKVIDGTTKSLLENYRIKKETTKLLENENLGIIEQFKLDLKLSEANRKIKNDKEDQEEAIWRLLIAKKQVLKLTKAEFDSIESMARLLHLFPELINLQWIENEKVRASIIKRAAALEAEKDALDDLGDIDIDIDIDIDVAKEIQNIRDQIEKSNLSLEVQKILWEELNERMIKAGFESQEIADILAGIEKEIEFKIKVSKVGIDIAAGFATAMKAESGEEGAKAFTGALRGLLSKAGWWGGIVGAFLEMFEKKTPAQVQKFLGELGENLGNIIEKVSTGILSFLANPLTLLKFIANIAKGIVMGIVNAITNLFDPQFWKELFDPTEEIEPPPDIDQYKITMDKINDAIDRFNHEVRMGNKTVKEQLEFWNDILKQLEDVAAPLNEIESVEETINDLIQDQNDLIQDQIDLIKERERIAFNLILARFNFELDMYGKTLEAQRDFYFDILKNAEDLTLEERNRFALILKGIQDQIDAQGGVNAIIRKGQQKLEDMRHEVAMNNLTLKEQLSILNQVLELYKWQNVPLENIRQIEEQIFDLKKRQTQELDNQFTNLNKIEADRLRVLINEITGWDKRLKLIKKAGLFVGTELEFHEDILDILQSEKRELEDLAKTESLIVENIEEYWDVLIEIEDISERIKNLDEDKVDIIQQQIDKDKELAEQQLSRITSLTKKILGTLGLPKFQLEFLKKQADIAEFGILKNLNIAGPQGFSLEQLETLASKAGDILTGIGIPRGAEDIRQLFSGLVSGETKTTIGIENLIGTLQTSGDLSIETIRPIMERVLDLILDARGIEQT